MNLKKALMKDSVSMEFATSMGIAISLSLDLITQVSLVSKHPSHYFLETRPGGETLHKLNKWIPTGRSTRVGYCFPFDFWVVV